VPPAAAAFVELPCRPAACRGPLAADRGSAQRLLAGHLVPSALAAPDAAPVSTPGRVHSLGRFEDAGLRAALANALPAALAGSLRPGFEWYACRGAFFHNDAHYEGVLFGAWCVGGPPREIVFARAGVRMPAAPGDWVAFDPFEPHAVLDPGAQRYRREQYDSAPASLFIGFELGLDDRVRAAFGIGVPPPGAPVLSSRVAINAETGSTG
jgi:hypothetical protein